MSHDIRIGVPEFFIADGDDLVPCFRELSPTTGGISFRYKEIEIDPNHAAAYRIRYGTEKNPQGIHSICLTVLGDSHWILDAFASSISKRWTLAIKLPPDSKGVQEIKFLTNCTLKANTEVTYSKTEVSRIPLEFETTYFTEVYSQCQAS